MNLGGSNSGRWGGRPTVEAGLTLKLGKLIRDGLLRPGQHRSGTLTWISEYTKKAIATIGFESRQAEDRGQLRLRYTITRHTGETHSSDYRIELVTTLQPLGGRRWWFVCPRSGRRVAQLHLPPGAVTFASRTAYRLGYRSQRESPRDRALSRAFKLRARLGASGGIGDVVFKPKGMHHTTFDRAMARVEEAENVCNGLLLLAVRRLSPGCGF